MHTHAKLIRTLVLGGLIAGCLSCLVPSTADAKIWESEEHNVLISIPDSPAPWIWLPAGQDWSKYGIVKGATRTIEELKSGEKPKGEHGLMHLIMRDAKEGETLESIVADGDTVETLMQRFGSKGDWPELESLKTSLNDDVPAVVLTASGKALNSKTGEYTRCEGRMLVTTVLGKVYFLRMYAWHTEYDGEGLKLDLDMIEGDFELLKTTGEEKPERPKDEPEAGAGDGPEPDEAKEETIRRRSSG